MPAFRSTGHAFKPLVRAAAARLPGLMLAAVAAATTAARAAEPVQVLVLGTYHFASPNLDLHNARVDDVLQPRRQAELAATVGALLRFRPTLVAVEVVTDAQPTGAALPRYRRYREGGEGGDGAGRDDRNEIAQIGYRLAYEAGLADVVGIDAPGTFPFGPVQDWARRNGQADALQRAVDDIGRRTRAFEARQAQSTIGQLLRLLNEPAAIAEEQAWYAGLLRYGRGAEQPGAALLAAWAARNFGICARLVQQVRPGDRAVVVYGSGHSAALRQCVREQPGWQLVEANDYLPP